MFKAEFIIEEYKVNGVEKSVSYTINDKEFSKEVLYKTNSITITKITVTSNTPNTTIEVMEEYYDKNLPWYTVKSNVIKLL